MKIYNKDYDAYYSLPWKRRRGENNHRRGHRSSLSKDGPISFNLMDSAISYVNDLPYAARSVSHLRLSLDNELLLRYLVQPTLEQNLMRQLNTEMVDPALLTLSQKIKGRN